jgi:hypothetical protein
MTTHKGTIKNPPLASGDRYIEEIYNPLSGYFCYKQNHNGANH